jgi:PAS domain S-box-containing protein
MLNATLQISKIAEYAFQNFDSPVIFTDVHGEVIWCNSAFEKLSEYKLDEIKGKTPGFLLQGKDSDREKIKMMANAIKEKLGFETEIVNYSKSGKQYLTQISCEPVFDDFNNHIGFYAIQPRVSRSRLINERLLTEANQLSQSIFDNAEVTIIIADDDMIVRNVNPFACTMLGYTKDELIGMKVMQYTRKVMMADYLWNDFIEKETQIGEIELIKKSGAVVYGKYRAVANVLPGKHLSVITDVTSIKQYQRDILAKNHELAEANKSMTTLFSIISHDLKSPLTNLQSALELLDFPDINPDEYKQIFESIAATLADNKIMLGNLLNWAKQQQDGFKIKPVDINIISFVKDLGDIFRKQASQKGITFETNMPSHPSNLASDPEVLKLILRNLCSNAIKFCNSGDKISLNVICNDNFIRFQVSDTGPGIAKEDIDKIFSTGFTTKGSRNEKGTGLGLTLCNKFISLLDSNLHVESELGKGTMFYFDLDYNYSKTSDNQ